MIKRRTRLPFGGVSFEMYEGERGERGGVGVALCNLSWELASEQRSDLGGVGGKE